MTLERWQAGPISGVPPLLQPVAHALLQAVDDLGPVALLPGPRLWARPGGVAAVGWHLVHLAGSTDRLFTYARGEPLTDHQRQQLARERDLPDPLPTGPELLHQWEAQCQLAVDQLTRTDPATLLDGRAVGRAQLPSTVLGLLFHAGEHAARHAGQAVTTMRFLDGMSSGTD